MNERQKLLVKELARATDILIGHSHHDRAKLTKPARKPAYVSTAERQIRALRRTIRRWEDTESRRIKKIRNRIEKQAMHLTHDIFCSTDADSNAVLRKIQRFERTAK